MQEQSTGDHRSLLIASAAHRIELKADSQMSKERQRGTDEGSRPLVIRLSGFEFPSTFGPAQPRLAFSGTIGQLASSYANTQPRHALEPENQARGVRLGGDACRFRLAGAADGVSGDVREAQPDVDGAASSRADGA